VVVVVVVVGGGGGGSPKAGTISNPMLFAGAGRGARGAGRGAVCPDGEMLGQVGGVLENARRVRGEGGGGGRV
jgi:hypothetical protein